MAKKKRKIKVPVKFKGLSIGSMNITAKQMKKLAEGKTIPYKINVLGGFIKLSGKMWSMNR